MRPRPASCLVRRARPGLPRAASSVVPRARALWPRDVFIAGFARTPFGAFCGSLARLPAPRLGAAAITAALRDARVQPAEVEALVLGHALPSGCGQHAARQACLLADLPAAVSCLSVNQACASGLQAVACAAQSVALGQVDLAVAGGMESMSQAPYLVRQVRTGGQRYGHGVLEDAALLDGLSDAHSGRHLGAIAEDTAQSMGLSREAQDAYAMESYRRTADAWQRGAMDAEVAPVRVRNPAAGNDVSTPQEPSTIIVSTDEEYSRLRIDTVAELPPVFVEGGSITAFSSSSLNDGAAAVVLVSQDKAKELGLSVVARILAIADHSVEPEDFAVAPAGAVRRALRSSRLSSVDFYEIHEAFAATAMANLHLLNLDPSRVNVNGGAVAIGHPLAASGTRLVCALLSVLDQQDAATGCAAIGGGGGSATALLLERVSL